MFEKLRKFLVGTALTSYLFVTSVLPAEAHVVSIPTGSAGSSTYDVQAAPNPPEPDGHGSFRIVCRYSHGNYDDAIAKFGQPNSTHLHLYYGNTGANAYSTYQSLRTTGNSTCTGGTANKSAYWVPAMIGGDHQVKLAQEAIFYYKAYDQGQNTMPPNGMKLIMGDASSSTPAGVDKVKWICDGVYSGEDFLTCPAGKKLTLVLNFPQCWDGVALDSPDHKSHVAYKVRNVCPAAQPNILPQLTFKFVWYLTESTNGWHLSSDMYDLNTIPAGRSAHADWFEGWDPATKQLWFQNCTNNFFDCGVGNLGDGRQLKRPAP